MRGANFLGTDMTDPEVVPYFTWDDPLTVREIQRRLRSTSDAELFRLLGKILREARDTDVWAFTRPEFVSRHWEKLSRHLGRRRAFWEWLLRQWREGPLPKKRIGNILVDPPQEILANKLCALLSRSELRDIVDVFALERAGFRVEDALPLAEKKDSGLTPAQLAWVLSQFDLASLPEGEPVLKDAPSAPTRRELAEYVVALGKRLVALALPPR